MVIHPPPLQPNIPTFPTNDTRLYTGYDTLLQDRHFQLSLASASRPARSPLSYDSVSVHFLVRFAAGGDVPRPYTLRVL